MFKKHCQKTSLSLVLERFLKHGLIRNYDYFLWMNEHEKEILALDYNTLEEMVYQSCLIKRDVVERDPKEKGERALLNFGHTIGHAVEKLSDFGLSHGVCVGLGMVAASYISCQQGNLTKEQLSFYRGDIKAFLDCWSVYPDRIRMMY